MDIQQNTNKKEQQPQTIIEKVQDKFNIDITKNTYPLQKPLNPTWIPQIIINGINMIKDIEFDYIQKNKSTGDYTLKFNNEPDVKKFKNKFNLILFKAINNYIKDQGLNPKNYKRGLTLEITDNDTILKINS